MTDDDCIKSITRDYLSRIPFVLASCLPLG
jgi:hypothetical protein